MDRLEELRAAKELLWVSILESDADKRAPLFNQWRALEATIADLVGGSVEKGDPIDELAARRAARGGATAASGKAPRSAR